jgi:hypothetical protein
MPGIHLRFHLGHLLQLPQSSRPAFRWLLFGQGLLHKVFPIPLEF